MHIIDRTFHDLLGLPCWKVEWEPRLGLKLSFGPPMLIVDEPEVSTARSLRVRRLLGHRRVTVRGTWWLWVLCGRWSLKLGDSPLRTTTSTSMRQKSLALGFLEGQKLTRATIDRETGATVLEFDLGAVLRIRGSFCGDGELYALYKPRGYVLSVRADGRYSHERGTRASRWRSARVSTSR